MAIEEQHMSILMTDHPCSSEANSILRSKQIGRVYSDRSKDTHLLERLNPDNSTLPLAGKQE